ncbi:MAG TPA: TIGR04219 family outer membrane beta-barrel protein [Nitrospirota bacterium]|nr:TIGR04219 family outer membrane beta-barrel protein [Nitrospirota bacterium]
MKKVHLYFVCLLVLSMVVIPYKAFAFFGVEAGVGYWRQAPSGTLEYKGDSLDLKNDLNLGDKNQVFARVKIELPLVLPNIYLMATPMSFSGTNQLTRPITFGNTTFDANTPIQTKLKMDHYDVALYYPIPLLKTATAGILNAELGLNARQIIFDGSITGKVLGVTETSSKSVTLYVPMIYAGVQVKPVSAFSIEGEIRGIAYGSNHYYDYIGRLKVMPFGPLFISGGYRSEQIKIDQSDVKTDAKFSGPFVEAGVIF